MHKLFKHSINSRGCKIEILSKKSKFWVLGVLRCPLSRGTTLTTRTKGQRFLEGDRTGLELKFKSCTFVSVAMEFLFFNVIYYNG